MNIHFVGCPFTKKEEKENDEKDDYNDSNSNHSETEHIDHESVDSTDLSSISAIGGMKAMDRGRSQSGPISSNIIGEMKTMHRDRSQSGHAPMMEQKPTVSSGNAFYRLRGVKMRSIRIRENPNKFTVRDLKKYITTKFNLPQKSKMYISI